MVFFTNCGQEVIVVKGDITDLNVDVIVNAVGTTLSHDGGLAKVLVSKGGHSIQTECDDFIISNGSMSEGEIFCSGVGKLKCQAIIHAVGPIWKGGRHQEAKRLYKCVKSAMTKTNEKKLNSIAFPAMCTGRLSYPTNEATQVILEAVRDYFESCRSDCSIQRVYLCELSDQTVNSFERAAIKVFGNSIPNDDINSDMHFGTIGKSFSEHEQLLHGLGLETTKDVLDIFMQGRYKCYWNRIYLIGPYGVGKSTLAKVLVGEKIPLNREATDGIWIYIGRAGMDVEEQSWKYFPKGNATFEILTNMLMSVEIESEFPLDPSACIEVVNDIQTIDRDLKTKEVTENQLNQHEDQVEDKYPVVASTIDTLTEIESTQAFQRKHFTGTINTLDDIKLPTVQKKGRKTKMNAESKLSYENIRQRTIQALQDGKYKQKIIPIDIWDFGGQKDYYMTHQLFITSRGVFVLMFNGSVDIYKHMAELSFLPGHYGKPTIAVYLIHWVNSVLTYSKRSDGGFPRIIFVATHKDQIPEIGIERHRLILVDSLKKLFCSHPGINHLEFDPLFFINARDKQDKEIEKLQDVLMERAGQHPRWGEEMPTAWVPLEIQIADEVENRRNIISREHIHQLNATNQPMELTDTELETFLKAQHSLGKLLYFDNVNLRDFIIINPAFLVEVLRSIVTEKQFWPEEKKLLEIFERLQQQGMITRNDVYKLWKQEEFSQLLPTKEYLIDMLVHLDILINPCSGHLYDSTDTTDDDFIVPCMIICPNMTKYLTKFCTMKKSIVLAYTFVEEVIPPAMVYRFLGSFINMWKIKIYEGNKMLFSDLAVVEVNENHDIVVQIQKNRLIVSLVHKQKKENIIPTLASSIQECLTASIRRITEFYVSLSGDTKSQSTSNRSNPPLSGDTKSQSTSNRSNPPLSGDTKSQSTSNRSNPPLSTTHIQGIESSESAYDISSVNKTFQIEFGVYCNRFFSKSAPCFFSHSNVSSLSKWKCPHHNRSHCTQNFTLWFAEKNAAETCRETCKGPGELELSQCPSEKHLRRLTKNLSVDSGREFFITLGMGHCAWDKLRDEYPKPDDCIFMALLTWKESNQNATFLQLQHCLERCSINTHLLCEVFRDINLDFSVYVEENLTKTPSDNCLLELSNHIGNTNIHLGLELGMKMSKIQEIQYQYRNKLLAQTKEILRQWKQQSTPKPTVHILVKAVHRIGKSTCLQGLKLT